MIKFYVLLVVLALLSCSCKSKIETSKIKTNQAKQLAKKKKDQKFRSTRKFADSFTYKALYDPKKNEVMIKITLKEGFHAYGLGEKIGRPVNFAIDPSNGWKIIQGPYIPKGQEKDLGDLGTSMILSGKIRIWALVKEGKGPIKGNLFLQVCTEGTCDRPRAHSFEIEMRKKGG